MGKNIVICCDGTGNSFENVDTDSNVVKLYSTLTIDESQIGYYHPGVGTQGAPHASGRFRETWSMIKGLAFGAGLLDNVGDAYRYLMDTYADGDQIFLFGFSRGAFTARALASLLHVYGLLCQGNHGAIPYILDMYARRTRQYANQARKQNAHGDKVAPVTFETDEAFKWQFSHANDVNIHFCGLWDTVSSYGWVYDPIELPFVGTNPIIEVGRQAVSIGERRCFYQDNLWGEAVPGQDIRQVWFSGVHSDIGGSYNEADCGLSKITLEWMLVEAIKAGLQVDEANALTVLGDPQPSVNVPGLPAYSKPDNDAALHASLKRFWWALEVLPQQDPHKNGKRWMLPMGRWRKIPAGSYIHESVLTSRWKPADLPVSYETEPWVRFQSAFEAYGMSA